jgi:methyl-accepting chemotaxis protein
LTGTELGRPGQTNNQPNAVTATSHFVLTFKGQYKTGTIMTTSEFDFANYKRTFRDRSAESNDSEMQAGNLSDLLNQVSQNSTSEIDSLIGEFQRLRGKLQTDSEHIRREIEKYAELSQQVMQVTKVISESVEKFRPSLDPS